MQGKKLILSYLKKEGYVPTYLSAIDAISFKSQGTILVVKEHESLYSVLEYFSGNEDHIVDSDAIAAFNRKYQGVKALLKDDDYALVCEGFYAKPEHFVQALPKIVPHLQFATVILTLEKIVGQKGAEAA